MTTRRAGWILIITYVVIGLAMQTVSCAWPSLGQDGQPSDVPCAGIPWSFFVILQWPLFAFFEIAMRQMTSLGITGLLGLGVMIALVILFRRFRVTKKTTAL